MKNTNQSRKRGNIKIIQLLVPFTIILVAAHFVVFCIHASTVESPPSIFDENDTTVDEEWVEHMLTDIHEERERQGAPSLSKPNPNKEMKNAYDVCVIGAGLSGSVIAERHANVLKKSVLVLEKRDHIGGNCYDYIDSETGIRVNKYGAHLFHTNSKRVWDYVQKFSNWSPYEHKVLGYVDGMHVPIPVNIDTVNQLFHLNISDSKEMDEWLANEQVHYDHEPTNSEEMALSRVGKRLYELIFKEYTHKQWNMYPQDLKPEVTARIPVRNDHDDRYFPNDVYQALPSQGYTQMFANMLNNPKGGSIDVFTNTDYFDVGNRVQCEQT